MKCRGSQHIKVCDDNKDEENNPAVNIINNDKSLPQKSRQKLYISCQYGYILRQFNKKYDMDTTYQNIDYK